ncbi:MAG: hypothetical protein SFU98_16340 [Leptospiraceae bacterium]|nr:hypothetical protein [Leptospiraceae bacterium]
MENENRVDKRRYPNGSIIEEEFGYETDYLGNRVRYYRISLDQWLEGKPDEDGNFEPKYREGEKFFTEGKNWEIDGRRLFESSSGSTVRHYLRLIEDYTEVVQTWNVYKYEFLEWKLVRTEIKKEEE